MRVEDILFCFEKYLCYLGANTNFQYHRTTPSGRKVTWGERAKKESFVNSGHLVPCRASKQLRSIFEIEFNGLLNF
jgi:hypothetical protein